MTWDEIRRPEYTGESRCWPCTTVNIGVVGLAALWLYRRDRRLLSLIAAVVGVAAVALRGYVVPYTPRFAPRLVAALPIPSELFEAEPGREVPESASLTGTELDGTQVLGELAAAGVVEADGDLIRPTADVDTAWREEMDRLTGESMEALADEAGATIPSLTGAEAYNDGDDAWLVVDGGLVARPVVVAELAAYSALDGHVADTQARLAGARAFRMFLDSCPVCETALVESSAVSCCGGYSDPQTSPEEILVCPECEQRLFTIPT